ncbi:MAG: T9SS type A sorting domain-containing protein [Bacteroidales bacterium]|nr:T9SS type A sorting domain-containing protein [Bacteroidales bacterium]
MGLQLQQVVMEGGTWRFDNVTFSGIAAIPVLTADPTTLSGFVYVEGNGPSASQSYTLNGLNLTGSGNITVGGTDNFEVSSNGSTFSSTATFTYAGGIITGQPVTVYVRMAAGLNPGDYNGEIIDNSGGGATTTVTCNGSITPADAPQIAEEILPQFIQGINGTNTNRVPYAYRVTLINLIPNATYRYFNSVVINGDVATSDGSGNVIYASTNGTFVRTSSPGLENAGDYGEFLTDATGSFTGWFMTEPTGNARFTPGNLVYMRICLNDGANGSVVDTRLTTIASAGVINFGNTVVSAEGTGIRCISGSLPKNFVFLYDNTAGNGRPLYGTSIETTGINFAAANSYATFYSTVVQGVNGSWGGIVPNVNAGGIRLIEELDQATGEVVSSNTSTDGVWGTTDTRNPTGGLDNILVIDLTGGTNPVINASPSILNDFTYIAGNGPSVPQNYTLTAVNLTGSGNILVTAPADFEISLNGTTYLPTLNLPFAGGIITGQPLTVQVRMKSGLVAGNYSNEQIMHSGGGAPDMAVTCSGTVTLPVPSIVSETIPQYIQGINGTNTQRVPFAFRASIVNLTPNATYRYFNKVVISSDSPTSDGSGNCIFVNADGTYTRSSGPAMDIPGEYGEFAADASGNYSGWFVTEPTGNARFTPGNEVFMRIILNDGNNGTTIAYRLTSTGATGVINFGNQNQAGQGTGIRGVSAAIPGNMIFLYDNTAGTGRPVNGSSVETTGIDFTSVGSYVGFYTSDVQGINGSWGSIVPNILPDGIRRVEERSRINGAVVAVHTSENGVWGAYDTRNPFGGDADILVLELLPVPEPLLSVNPSILNGFIYTVDFGPSPAQTYQLGGSDLTGSGNITVSAPANYEIASDGTNYTSFINFPFANGTITGQPVTVSVRLKAGLPAGEYNGESIVNSGGGATDKTVTCSGLVTTDDQPVLSNVTLPLYIQGINGTNETRVPFAFRATIVNLSPDATYRYFNKVVAGSDPATSDGAGNAIYVSEEGTFTRTSSTSLGTPGEYGEFITDINGTFTGWFIAEPTGNERFTPGNQLYMRIALNDGAEGSTVANRVTTIDFTTVLQFGTEALLTHGTAIEAVSLDNPGDFVYLFDNTEGTGRPLYATHIETSGVDFCATGVYAPFYCNSVTGVDGSWGGIVPNVNDAGVQRIEIRNLSDGSLLGEYLSPDGWWQWGVDTQNPSGGVENTLFISLLPWSTDQKETEKIKISSFDKDIRIQFPATINKAEFILYTISGQEVLKRSFNNSGEYFLQTDLPSGIYIARLIGANILSENKLFIR